jgi:hypothetical protein
MQPPTSNYPRNRSYAFWAQVQHVLIAFWLVETANMRSHEADCIAPSLVSLTTRVTAGPHMGVSVERIRSSK